MIQQALQHCRGIGPVRLAHLHELGVRSWMDVVAEPQYIPVMWRPALVAECHRCLQALEMDDLHYFVDRFVPQDKWRILSHYLEQASYFDIETAGLEYDAPITVIVCWHQGRLYHFVEHQNLDEFLPLLDQIQLLVSFNGNSFDVPRVLDTFHIPQLPCAHLDLRWPCYHQRWRGGLKEITTRLGIQRPADLHDADGQWAVHLWNQWTGQHDQTARDQLIRYCAADVLLLVLLAQRLVRRVHLSDDELWLQLPEASDAPAAAPVVPPPVRTFGAGAPLRLRARRRRLVG